MNPKFVSALAAFAIPFAALAEEAPYSIHSDLVPLDPNASDGNEYLYEIAYSDWNPSIAEKYFSMHAAPIDAAACSSVRVGDFHGRNLDFYINRDISAVIHMAASPERFASVGVAACCHEMNKPDVDAGRCGAPQFDLFPAFTCDGINENGVAVNINVVPLDETDGDDVCSPTTGTTPGADPLCIFSIPRFVLDNARSADHAVEILSRRNLYIPHIQGLPFEAHFMISDPQKTLVVEFWDNQMVVVPTNVMLNFYASHPDAELGMGHERDQLLNENLGEAVSVAGMHHLLSRVWYSQVYAPSDSNIFFSEFLSSKPSSQGVPPTSWSQAKRGELDGIRAIMDKAAADFGSLDAQKSRREGICWCTIHSAVYDIPNRTLSLVEQETDVSRSFSIAPPSSLLPASAAE